MKAKWPYFVAESIESLGDLTRCCSLAALAAARLFKKDVEMMSTSECDDDDVEG